MATATVPTITIGRTGLRVAPLGTGTWAWGDTLIWGYGRGFDVSDIAAAFWTSLNEGVTFFDTAEMYGNGTSERLLGKLAAGSSTPLALASKYAPLPWRLSARSLGRAIDGTLKRLRVRHISLYQVHWPFPIVSNAQLMDAMADAVAEGKISAVGVSNYSAEQMEVAHAALARRGVPLASNQVEYSLLARKPETNGVLATCRDLGVTLIAYSPLGMGLLTGKYKPGAPPPGARRLGSRFQTGNLAAAQPVIDLLQRIGAAHDGKTPSQVALNWLIFQGVLPIPGAKNAAQAADNAGALGWSITASEAEALDQATRAWRN